MYSRLKKECCYRIKYNHFFLNKIKASESPKWGAEDTGSFPPIVTKSLPNGSAPMQKQPQELGGGMLLLLQQTKQPVTYSMQPNIHASHRKVHRVEGCLPEANARVVYKPSSQGLY